MLLSNHYGKALLTTCSTESFLYRYSWDLEDLRSYPWARHYVQGPEVLAYLNHVVKRHKLRPHFQFNTEMIGSTWNAAENRWTVETDQGFTFKPRYLITALGLLSKQNFPDIKGLKTFEGELHHTARWPESLDLTGKRVGVIGNGSTGVQVITAVAPIAKELLCFQRNPQFSVPSGNKEVAPEYRQEINERYDKIWAEAKNSMFAFGFEESNRPTFSVAPEEREKIYEEAWQLGGGFRFMFWTFNDLSTNEDANHTAADFIRRKIRETINDPEKARKLSPTQLYARRPLCDAGYYQQFNRKSVDIIDINATPITEITPKGIMTSDGKVHELDVIVFATGFDAVDGNYTRVVIKGRSNQNLQDHWVETGPSSYLGISVPDFPNLFMVLGPNSPFTNLPPTIETQVEFIANAIKFAGKAKPLTNGGSVGTNDTTNGHIETGKAAGSVIEATSFAEEDWGKLCDELSSGSLFRKTDSWIFGANVEGKRKSVLFYFGGLKNYINVLKDVVDNNYKGYKPFVVSEAKL